MRNLFIVSYFNFFHLHSLILLYVFIYSQLWSTRVSEYSSQLAKGWTWLWKFFNPKKKDHLWISWTNLWIRMYSSRGRIYLKRSTYKNQFNFFAPYFVTRWSTRAVYFILDGNLPIFILGYSVSKTEIYR